MIVVVEEEKLLFVYASVYLSVCLSAYLLVYLSLCQSEVLVLKSLSISLCLEPKN